MKEFRIIDNNRHEYYVNADEFKRCDNIIYLYEKNEVSAIINFNNVLMIEELKPYEEIL